MDRVPWGVRGEIVLHQSRGSERAAVRAYCTTRLKGMSVEGITDVLTEGINKYLVLGIGILCLDVNKPFSAK